jgi:hypothetical protein
MVSDGFLSVACSLGAGMILLHGAVSADDVPTLMGVSAVAVVVALASFKTPASPSALSLDALVIAGYDESSVATRFKPVVLW